MRAIFGRKSTFFSFYRIPFRYTSSPHTLREIPHSNLFLLNGVVKNNSSLTTPYAELSFHSPYPVSFSFGFVFIEPSEPGKTPVLVRTHFGSWAVFSLTTAPGFLLAFLMRVSSPQSLPHLSSPGSSSQRMPQVLATFEWRLCLTPFLWSLGVTPLPFPSNFFIKNPCGPLFFTFAALLSFGSVTTFH